MAEKIWLIGEHNPYGEKEKYALFPYPENSAGGRLCRKIFGMTAGEYLRTFERRNLMQKPKWAMGEGRAAAAEILKSAWPDPVVLLGKKVAGSFDLPFEPFSQTWYPSKDGPWGAMPNAGRGPVLVLPHPSGRCRIWNDPDAIQKARKGLEAIRHG